MHKNGKAPIIPVSENTSGELSENEGAKGED